MRACCFPDIFPTGYYMRPLLERIQKREIDPRFVITHHMALDEAPEGYRIFNAKTDDCEKIVLKPH